jgi:hypothetical protein
MSVACGTSWFNLTPCFGLSEAIPTASWSVRKLGANRRACLFYAALRATTDILPKSSSAAPFALALRNGAASGSCRPRGSGAARRFRPPQRLDRVCDIARCLTRFLVQTEFRSIWALVPNTAVIHGLEPRVPIRDIDCPSSIPGSDIECAEIVKCCTSSSSRRSVDVAKDRPSSDERRRGAGPHIK